MSIIQSINIETDFKPDLDFYEKAVSCLFGKLSGHNYYYDDDHPDFESDKNVLNDNTFAFFWNSFPSARESLITNLCRSYQEASSSWRRSRYSSEFAEESLKFIYNKISSSEDIKDVKLFIEIAAVLDIDYNYLEACYKYSLDVDKKDVYDVISQSALARSKDPQLYDFLFSKIKREPGSVEKKIEVLERAIRNDSLSSKLLNICAKRGTKNMKRTAVKFLTQKMREERHRLNRAVQRQNEVTESVFQKNIDEIEEKIMLFVDCDDAEVVQDLMDSLSKNNLPWLMPAASKHTWLSNRLQRKIDQSQ